MGELVQLWGLWGCVGLFRLRDGWLERSSRVDISVPREEPVAQTRVLRRSPYKHTAWWLFYVSETDVRLLCDLVFI